MRAIQIKGDQLRTAVRNGRQFDWGDIHDRFVDLWQESRLCLWRAKRSKSGLKVIDPKGGKEVLTFIADDKTLLQAIDTCHGILDSMVKLRKEMGPDATAVPHWVVEKIAGALRDYPEAQRALLKAFAEGDDEKLN